MELPSIDQKNNTGVLGRNIVYKAHLAFLIIDTIINDAFGKSPTSMAALLTEIGIVRKNQNRRKITLPDTPAASSLLLHKAQ